MEGVGSKVFIPGTKIPGKRNISCGCEDERDHGVLRAVFTVDLKIFPPFSLEKQSRDSGT